MRLPSIALASLLSETALAFSVAQTWSGNNCRGSSEVLSGVSGETFTYPNLPGASIFIFDLNVNPGGPRCTITTWSGTNNRGSSVNFDNAFAGGCNVLPFGSVTVAC